MLDREAVLESIASVYVARMRGDKEAVFRFCAPNAVFRIGADPAQLPTIPIGAAKATTSISELMGRFKFHSMQRVDAVVEGGKAAILWRVVLSWDGREPVTTEIFELWTLEETGKATSLVQFVDTALIASTLS
jgi:ketosteroid isomerase-like protein